MNLRNKLKIVIAASLSTCLAWTLPASAETADLGAVTVTGVRSTSLGEVWVTFSGGIACNGQRTVVLPKEHAARTESISLATAALLSGKSLQVWVENSDIRHGFCAAVGFRLNSN
jgi:hypothetical protein